MSKTTKVIDVGESGGVGIPSEITDHLNSQDLKSSLTIETEVVTVVVEEEPKLGGRSGITESLL